MHDREARDLGDVLERAHSEIVTGKLVEWHTDEVELHAPVPRRSRGRLEVDPDADAVLRERLVAERPKRHSPERRPAQPGHAPLREQPARGTR